jgi:hypothetical protein
MGVFVLALGFRWVLGKTRSTPAALAAPVATFLGLRPRLEDVDHFLSSPEHNPAGVELCPKDKASLQGLIDTANVRLDQLQTQVGDAALAWARLCIAIGNFDLVEKGQDRRHHPGTLLLRVTDRYGVKRDVVIQPGECAEVDVLTADVDAEIEAAKRGIADFLELRTDRSNPVSKEALR